jgi:uncharacterized RDD family membrane protein YckC
MKVRALHLWIKRLLAYWLDFVLLATVLIGLQGIIYMLFSGFPYALFTKGFQIELWVLLTMSLPVWLYFVWLERVRQRTIGKRLFRLIVTNRQGSSIGWGQAILRTFVKLLPWEMTHLIVLVPEPWWSVESPQNAHWIWLPNAAIVLYIAVLIRSKGKKGLHDYVAQTQVQEAALGTKK